MDKNYSKLFLLFFMAALIIPSCKKKEQAQEIIRPVRYIQVLATGGSRVRTFPGVAQAGTESRLSFKVLGTVQRVAVGVGDRVQKGQIIAELDPYDYQLNVQQARASLLQAEAQARNANAAYSRTRSLYENKSASKQDLDAARMAYESANAMAQASSKQLEQAQLQLSYTKITAPTDGAIAEVNCEVNENVQAGMPLFLLTAGSQLEIRVSIPEILISQIEENKEVSATFDAIPEKKFQAIVSEVGIKSTTLATTYPVILLLKQTDPDIRAGMAASVSFRFESKDERVRFIVPSEAVGEDREGRFVFTVERLPEQEGLGIVRRKPVAVGELTEEGLEIFEGLADGDLVVTAGISHIVDGKNVKL
ncbi:MAG: efflux RND transporter periplasmic adaptor subunit [Candidatus Aminicenantes bacterium]|nr:efflux RND transporter periplasmic adaptor subunit [Candidatus Aminicenantes bacterium]